MYKLLHNLGIMKEAEKMINSFIDDPDVRLWITDEDGKQFVPKGNITINYCEFFKVERR